MLLLSNLIADGASYQPPRDELGLWQQDKLAREGMDLMRETNGWCASDNSGRGGKAGNDGRCPSHEEGRFWPCAGLHMAMPLAIEASDDVC